MNFRLIKYFLAVASNLSFSRAAENLHISQSTLSQQIQQLEAHYGVRLFNREGRSVTLTAAGVELQEFASRMLVEEEQLQRRLEAIDSGVKTETYPMNIFFDAHMTVSPHLSTGLTESILSLQKRLDGQIVFHPHFVTADLDDPLLELNTVLANPQTDIWLMGAEKQLHYPGIRFETLFVDNFALLISRNHPLYREDLALEDIPYILNHTILFMIQNRSKHFRTALDHLPGADDIDPSIRFERSADVISVYVSLGVGVSIVPIDNRNESASVSCKSIAIPNTAFYTLLGCRADSTNPLIPMLMEELRKNIGSTDRL